jgi:hypothetical protein
LQRKKYADTETSLSMSSPRIVYGYLDEQEKARHA